MFLQRYVHVVLDAVLGAYVKNIDPEALKISVWNGKIEVDVVELQPEGFPLPPEWRIVKGTLHQLRIDLPWSNLSNQPIRVDVQDVSLLVEVCDRQHSNAPPSAADPAAAARRDHDRLRRKRATIEAIEKTSQLDANGNSSEAAAAGSSSSWTQSLVFKLLVKVLDNVQLNVQHVHLRLEDRVSDPSRPFAVGLTLDSMIIKSADEGWNYTTLVRSASASQSSFLRKKVDVNKLGVYWSLPLVPVPQSALDDAFAFVKIMQMSFWSSSTADSTRMPRLFDERDYLVQPLTLMLRLTVNDGMARLPITHHELSERVMARLGTPWKVLTINAIGDAPWQEFVDMMPRLAGNRKYTLGFVFSEAWAVAREATEEDDAVPSVSQFKGALSSCLQWPLSDVERLEESIIKYRDAVVHVMEEKSTYIDATAEIDQIQIALQRDQYLSALGLASFLNKKRRQARYAQLRPRSGRPSQCPRLWWKYAIEAVLIDVRERLARVDWKTLSLRSHQHARYKALYLCLTKNTPPPVSDRDSAPSTKEQLKQEFDALELELDIKDILQLRKAARISVTSKAEKSSHLDQQTSGSGTEASSHAIQPSGESNVPAPPITSRLWGYTSWLYGTAQTGQTGDSNRGRMGSTPDADEDIEWSDQDTQLLFQTIDYHPDKHSPGNRNEVDGRKKDDSTHIWYRFQLRLGLTGFHLSDGQSRLLSATLNNLDVKTLVRPSSIEFGIQCGDLKAIERPTLSSESILLQRMSVQEIVRQHQSVSHDEMNCIRLQHCENDLPMVDVRLELVLPSGEWVSGE
ncbi:hypothetical protein PINS_up011166 [Pythium insidiosum]|nr:hypothetical protein PINS_up011166 [Pythium insidiosum]